MPTELKVKAMHAYTSVSLIIFYIESRCVNGYKSLAGSCYKIFFTYASWFQATETCRAQGASLASIHSEAESKALFKEWHDRSHRTAWWGKLFFIGASKLRTGNTWEWWDGSPWDYAHLDGSVKADTPDNCLAMKWDWAGRWVAVPCMKIGHRRGFFCKMKKVKSKADN